MSKPASLPRQIPVGVLSLIAGVVILACCVGWAFLAQTLVTPACDLPELPPNVNLIICDDLMELIEPGE